MKITLIAHFDISKVVVLLMLILLNFYPKVNAQQLGTYLGDETPFYAATKQMSQFFRRFNNEEDRNGKPYFSTDKMYRETEQRKRYINLLFNNDNQALTTNLRNEFIQEVTSKESGQFLDFHGGKWFAEVRANFMYLGKPEIVTLFLELQKEGLGSKWVLSNVYFPAFNNLFLGDTTGASKKFLHPQSHEIDFMNLIRAFETLKDIELYTKKGYQPDMLSIFFYEMKKNTLRFETVAEVKFHFLQIKNWYFEVSNFNRIGNNTGWLISNLMKVPENQKSILEKFIFTKK
jgi:hypothetical protein